MPASQAGRRRFDPGRPLHSFLCNSNDLARSPENSPDRDRALSPIHHLNEAGKGSVKSDFLALAFALRGLKSWLVPVAARRARRLPRRGFENLFDALEREALFIRVRRSGQDAARAFFEFAINPERFAELRKADASDRAGKVEGGEITSGQETLPRDEAKSRGDEATGLRGTAWRSPRTV